MSNAGFGPAADMIRRGVQCEAVEVDLADNSTVAVNAACELLGVYVNTVLSAHVCPIQNDTTEKLRLVASLAAGTLITLPAAVKFATNLTVDPNDSATGLITLFYRLL